MLVANVSKSFKQKRALREITLELSEGAAHGLLGANGAGKTTLIKTLMGLVTPDQGDIQVSKHIALLAENPYLPDNLSAYQLVRFAAKVQKKPSVDDLLREVQLKEEAWHKPIRTYSKGMKQRTAIAAVLAGDHEWLILDEPMSGLDAMGRKQMLELFARRHAQGTSILMCSHSVTDLVRLCNHIHILANGQYCETVDVIRHSMDEVVDIEQRLEKWSGNHAVD